MTLKGASVKSSEQISAFLRFCTESEKNLAGASVRELQLNNTTQDILHDLELGDLNYKERAKVATKLAGVRRERRIEKDTVEELEDFVNWYTDPVTKRVLDQLRNVLGKVRKQEEYHENRSYKKKGDKF